jgi:hypothetical protein
LSARRHDCPDADDLVRVYDVRRVDGRWSSLSIVGLVVIAASTGIRNCAASGVKVNPRVD